MWVQVSFCCGTFCSFFLLSSKKVHFSLFRSAFFSSPFVSMFSFSPFQRPAFCSTRSHLSRPSFVSALLFCCSRLLSTVQLSQAKCPPSTHTMHPSLWPLSYLFPSITLSCVTPPSMCLSRDNYNERCEDQLVFKQLNKQGLRLLTVAIQQQSSETVEQGMIVWVRHYGGHLKTSLLTNWWVLIVSPVMSNTPSVCGHCPLLWAPIQDDMLYAHIQIIAK